jgi:hypothetical protein
MTDSVIHGILSDSDYGAENTDLQTGLDDDESLTPGMYPPYHLISILRAFLMGQ